ncbi:MAG: SIMPL domain-containing protein [Candidatus Sungbacteria bacterium]|uniref:SIMPL domain-containing protein n=1 Tax=Candidatus Sungiibacteriota bacterium TaxID=2750080 RepID=A0A932YVI8_9BACT|nr:SIMPL domain-containing protein [Candidatus Sungbacteria bacterium]
MLAFYSDLAPREKRAARSLALLFLLLLNAFLLVLAASYGFAAWREGKGLFGADKQLQVSVAGEGKVTGRPDVAKITATVLSESDTLSRAQDENAKKSNAVTAYLEQQGVAEKDVKTVGYNIFPQYYYPGPCQGGICPLDSQRPRIIGYQIRNTYEITVRDLGKANAILAGIVAAGVNEVGGIAFVIDQPDELKVEARRKAIADARLKAEELARDLNKRLGRIIAFSEGGGVPPPIIYGQEAFGKGGGGGPSVQPGENEVVVSVNITYELK